MNFKNAVEKDIENVFINMLEFADTHIFNDRVIKCVVDEDKFAKKMEKDHLQTIEGIIQKGFTLYISKKDVPVRPHPFEVVEFDEKEYTVANCTENMGIIELDLYLYDSTGAESEYYYG